MDSQSSGKINPLKGILFWSMALLLVMEIWFPIQLQNFIMGMMHWHSQGTLMENDSVETLRTILIVVTIVALIRILRS